MVESTIGERCTSCGKTAQDTPEKIRLLCCSKCQQAGVWTFYCSRDCQVSDYKQHKQACGKLRSQRSFVPPEPLLRHREALAAILDDAPPADNPPSFLYRPAKDDADAAVTPIVLSEATRPLFRALLESAFRTGLALSVNLLFSLLAEPVVRAGGTEGRLIAQLAEEYAVDLNEVLEDEEDPSEEELVVAVGGQDNVQLLLSWQMEEAERSRTSTGPS